MSQKNEVKARNLLSADNPEVINLPSFPTNPSGVLIEGSSFWDSVLDVLKVYDGSTFITIGAGSASSGAAGSVQFSDGSGGFNSAPTQLFWDNSTNKLGVRTNAPIGALDVIHGGSGQGVYFLTGHTAGDSGIAIENGASIQGTNGNLSGAVNLTLQVGGGHVMLSNSATNMMIGSSATPLSALHIQKSSALKFRMQEVVSSSANFMAFLNSGGDYNHYIGSASSSGVGLFGSGDAFALEIGTVGAHNISFHTNNVTTPRLKITNTQIQPSVEIQWRSGVAGVIRTEDNGATTQNLTVRAGDSGGSGTAGTLLLRSGANSGSNSTGAVTLQSGDHSGVGSGASGLMTIRTGNSGTGGSGGVAISTGSATNSSGNITLTTGSASSPGVFRFLRSGVPSVAGQVWTASGVDGTGYWASAGAGANTSLSNLSAVAINADLDPATTNARALGSSSLQWLEAYILRTLTNFTPDTYIDGLLTGVVTGRTGVGIANVGGFGIAQNPLYVTTADNSVNNTVPTGDISILSGTKTVGTAASGAINIQTGTATGTRGDITLNSRVVNLTTTNGVGVTGNMNPSAANTYNLGASSAAWNIVYTRLVLGRNGDFAAGSDFNTAFNSSFESGSSSGAANVGTATLRSGDNLGGSTGLAGNVIVKSGSISEATNSNNTGDILIQIGTTTGAGARGKVKIQDGSQGTVGHVWTQTNADGSGAWQAAASGGANTTLSNLTSPTAINQDLLPSGTRSLGNPGFTYWQDLALGGKVDFYDAPGFSNRYEAAVFASAQASPSGATAAFALRGVSAGRSISIYSATATSSTGSVLIASGNSTTSGNTGDIELYIGTITSGTRGKLKIKDGSEGTIGHVWTSTGTDGSGAWAAPGGGGANTALSNLSAVAVNVDLDPATNNARALGNSTFQWIDSYVLRYLSTLSGETMVSGQIGGLGSGGGGPWGSIVLGIESNNVATSNNSTNNSTATGAVNITTGNKTAGTGNSGNINLQTGTSTGGTRGRLLINDASLSGSAVGHVWTLTNTSTGAGAWTAPASVGSVQLELNTGNGQGSTATRTRRWTNVGTNTLGSHATYTDSATDGGTVTIVTAGFWSITYNDAGTTGNPNFGITINANGADSILTVTPAQRRTVQCGVSANVASSSWVGYLNASDVIRFQTDTATPLNAFAGVGARVSFLGP